MKVFCTTTGTKELCSLASTEVVADVDWYLQIIIRNGNVRSQIRAITQKECRTRRQCCLSVTAGWESFPCLALPLFREPYHSRSVLSEILSEKKWRYRTSCVTLDQDAGTERTKNLAPDSRQARTCAIIGHETRMLCSSVQTCLTKTC